MHRKERTRRRGLWRLALSFNKFWKTGFVIDFAPSMRRSKIFLKIKKITIDRLRLIIKLTNGNTRGKWMKDLECHYKNPAFSDSLISIVSKEYSITAMQSKSMPSRQHPFWKMFQNLAPQDQTFALGPNRQKILKNLVLPKTEYEQRVDRFWPFRVNGMPIAILLLFQPKNR